MCGICGIKGIEVNRRQGHISDMLDLLGHRGPDQRAVYHDNEFSLGVVRLKIIDLETGSQPLYNESRDIVLICNGEIYNSDILRNELAQKGHLFRTRSDAEVIIHLYEDLGLDCLNELRGMFAFALWDKNKKLAFIARDRLGIKPLYYINKNGIFAFASELKALSQLSFASKSLNLDALDLYFSLEYIPAPLSIYKDIFKLPAGHYILFKGDESEIRPFWCMGAVREDRKISFDEAKEKLEHLLKESVREHLRSDSPLGIFLSGGIDSSMITALAASASHEVNTFSMGFGEKSFDESEFAQKVSRNFKTKHQHFYFSIKDFIDILPEVIKGLDQPLADQSIFPTYLLCKLSRQSVKVILSGEGADELFMGYPTYLAHRYMESYQAIPEFFRKYMFTPLISSLPVSFENFSLDFKLKQFLRGQFIDDFKLRHLTWMGSFFGQEKEQLYAKDFRPTLSRQCRDYIKILSPPAEIKKADPLKGVQYLDINGYLKEGLLVKADTAGMRASLEIRVPFLDQRLVEFVLSLPTRFIFQKRILKAIAKNYLPRWGINRPKKGFGMPFSSWLGNKIFFDQVACFFSAEFINRQKIFNYQYLKRILDEHLNRKKDNRKKLSTYIMFQAWYSGHFTH